MSKKETGGHAFPTQWVTHGNTYDGMTLRDWFAGQIINGICSAPFNIDQARDSLRDHERAMTIAQLLAGRSYELADAMLAERAK